jgi:uncharacterized protein YecE (DUF72 family)
MVGANRKIERVPLRTLDPTTEQGAVWFRASRTRAEGTDAVASFKGRRYGKTSGKCKREQDLTSSGFTGPGGGLRLGTSSFSSPDWVGPFYPKGTKPSDFLRLYAEHYDTVEVDATYYRVPESGVVRHWAEVTPAGFLFSLKFPKSIVHGGEGAIPDGKALLTPDATYLERDRFLEVTEPLGDKCGPLLLQFPYLARKAIASPSEFLDRLDRFLGDLPSGRRYAVEIRNRNWLGNSLSELCVRHRTALVASDQAWMPRPWELDAELKPVTTDFAYARLIGDRKEIEAKTEVWNREVIDRGPLLEKWAGFLVGLLESRIPVLVYINNHFAGFAPATALRLKQLYDDARKKHDT